MNPLLETKRIGHHIWLDNLSRTLLQENTLKTLIQQDGISGVTSNPSIFYKAVSESPYYRDELVTLKTSSLDENARYERLVIPDIQVACDLLRQVFEQSDGDDGYVSLEVSPLLAYDEEQTVSEAHRLADLVSRDNLLIKIPATLEGIRAFDRLIGEGVNVNVTLMFSLQHVENVAHSYLRGLRRWVDKGNSPRRIKAVASVFLSRVDTLVDRRLEAIGSPQALSLRGQAAVSMAKLAYQRYLKIFHGDDFSEIREAGGRPQYLLWASTGTKNPTYSDVLYVESLIGPETINTVPDATIAAFRDHGRAAPLLTDKVNDAEVCYQALRDLGIDLDEVGEQLQREGVKSFDEAFAKLMALMR